jgi:two-component system chemotaxis sensor kinase CheA
VVELSEKAREEFLAEAHDIVETLSRNLLLLDAADRAAERDPSVVNEAFRAVHTLKGLSGLFGASRLGALSHRLEDLLDALRLGKRELSQEVLDVLFMAVDVFGQVLEHERAGKDEPIPRLDALYTELERLGGGVEQKASDNTDYDLDPGMLAVLTEYEEHRLRANIDLNQSLYKLRVEFDLSSIDRSLEEIKEKARLHGEIITYLPAGSASSTDKIELDILLASKSDLATLIGALGNESVIIEQIPRKAQAASRPQPPVPSSIGTVASKHTAQPAKSDRKPSIERALGADKEQRSLRSVTQTVRVDIRKLDHLMNIVGELGLVRSALGRIGERVRGDGHRALAAEISRLHRGFDRRLAEIQAGILEVRMVPLGQVFERLARVTRQISREVEKDIRLVITGAETEIDKLIVEELSDPLMHMLRNAIDHGIERAEERRSAGKPDAGTIALNAYQQGSHVMIEIEDDGKGIDEEALLDKARALGKLEPGEEGLLTRDEILALIFLPGLSTRSSANDVSGRGVGMDIVKTNIAKIGGVIDVQSERGIGTKMTITLPITLAIVSALLVRVEESVFALPLATVSEALSFDESMVRAVEDREVITLRGATLPICRLQRLLELDRTARSSRGFVVIVTLANRRLGLVVDHLFGQEDIVIKPLGKSLSQVRSIAGATELGDQKVSLVLDTASIIEEVLSSSELGRERLGVVNG